MEARRPLQRQLAEWRLLVPMAGRVLALQGSHPTVAAGMYQHSDVFDDPWKRGVRTSGYAQRLMFGPDRVATAEEIRRLHRHVKGVGLDGRRYHAWNREAWTWVHLTTVEATLFALEKIHGRLPADDIEELYRDSRILGMLYGVRDRDMPDDVDGLRRYVEEGVEERCTHRPHMQLVPSLQHLPPPWHRAGPALLWAISPLWALSMLPGSHPVHIALAGSFPQTIRRRWGIRWSPVHELEYRAQLTVLRSVTNPLPDRLRTLPYPYRMLRNPEPAT